MSLKLLLFSDDKYITRSLNPFFAASNSSYKDKKVMVVVVM